jgi:hypothetical protein
MLTEATTLSTTAIQRQAITVEVQNGSLLEGLDGLAASRLNYAGYATHISPADRQDYGNSVLIDMTSSQDPDARSVLLGALGLDSATILSSPDPSSGASYRLILGSDYQPCFQPQALSH